MRLAVGCIFLCLSVSTYAETVVYGVKIPEEVQKHVEEEANDLGKETAVYLERKRRFSQYEEALKEQAKKDALQEYRHNRFPQFPPEVIEEERERNFDYERARKRPLFNVRSTIESINVDPLQPQTHTLKATQGEPTRLIFMDQSGNPWPVIKVDSGKSNRLGAKIIDEIKDENQIAIELEDNFVSGNILINLADYGAPLVIRIVADPELSTAYANVRIERPGPNTDISLTQVGSGIADSGAQCRDVYRLLENASMEQAKRHYLSGIPGQVWVTDENTYIRSTHRLVFPFGTCQTSDGNGNYGARVEGTDVYTATFLTEGGKYKTVRINDIAGGQL